MTFRPSKLCQMSRPRRAKHAQIYFDSSPGQSEDLLNPAELLLSAFAACLLKNVERLAPILHLTYQRAAVNVHGLRKDKPPRLTRIEWTLTLWTDEPPQRVDLLDRNLRKQGTIYNTLAAACEIHGSTQILPRTDTESAMPGPPAT